MIKTYKSNNISCIKCANLIKISLEDEFDNIEVNLNTNPKEVSLEIEDEAKEVLFKSEMADIGFDIIEE